MAYFISPIGNSQFSDANGDPGVGFKVYTYLAGSTTATATYTSNTGAVQQANYITLNSLGLPNSPIWLAEGISYKFVFKDADDVTLLTIDNIEGVNDAATSASEWLESGFVPTYLSATTFSVPGDKTDTLQVGRRLKTTNTAGAIYSRITISSFAAAATTVTVVNDSGVLDAGLSAVAYGLLSITNPSIPETTIGKALRVAADSAAVHAAAPILAGTSQATTSGTSIDFTGIPSWVKRITLNLAGVSGNGTSNPLVQIGDSGGIEATGYLGSGAGGLNAASPGVANYTTGFGISSALAANVLHGSIVLTLLDAATNTWVASGNLSTSNTAAFVLVSGSKALSATLDRIRLTFVNGTDAFDAGLANILYE